MDRIKVNFTLVLDPVTLVLDPVSLQVLSKLCKTFRSEENGLMADVG